jgi:hypothetical protein
MRLILWLLVPPLLLFGLALLMVWAPLPPPFPQALSQGRNLVAALVIGAAGVVYVVGTLIFAVAMVARMGRYLDPALTLFGLEPRSHRLMGRRYEGVVQGRRIRVAFVPGTALRPAVVDIYVNAGTGWRAALGDRRPMLDCRDCVPVQVDDPDLRNLTIVAEDPAPVQCWLADAPTHERVLSLLHVGHGTRELYIQPEHFWFRAHVTLNAASEQVPRWLSAMLRLAQDFA